MCYVSQLRFFQRINLLRIIACMLIDSWSHLDQWYMLKNWIQCLEDIFPAVTILLVLELCRSAYIFSNSIILRQYCYLRTPASIQKITSPVGTTHAAIWVWLANIGFGTADNESSNGIFFYVLLPNIRNTNIVSKSPALQPDACGSAVGPNVAIRIRCS